ncbi:hypothetical protein V1477_011872 [Vespula maculifrons]|uniref:Uncharacterized protein n=1 Tax=Vespula maculifrons TaxID=7453 RepID=A0ABD2C260_VESMC
MFINESTWTVWTLNLLSLVIRTCPTLICVLGLINNINNNDNDNNNNNNQITERISLIDLLAKVETFVILLNIGHRFQRLKFDNGNEDIEILVPGRIRNSSVYSNHACNQKYLDTLDTETFFCNNSCISHGPLTLCHPVPLKTIRK